MKLIRPKQIFILLAGIYFNISAPAQAPVMPDELKQSVLKNNLTLIAASEQLKTREIASRTGIAPSDPFVEVGYMSGNPADIGRRIDFSVVQEFDFPTTYFQEADKGVISRQLATLAYEMEQQKQLSRARGLWIRHISLEKQQSLLNSRLEKSNKLREHYRTMLNKGEISSLALSQVNLQLVSLQSEAAEVTTRIKQNLKELEGACGGNLPVLSYDVYPILQLPSIDSLISAYRSGPETSLFNTRIRLMEQEKKLAVSRGLPSFSAGYYSESVVAEQFKGIQVGMSVPLWQNKNRVKLSRVEIDRAETERERFMAEQEISLEQQFDELKRLQKSIETLETALEDFNDLELLGEALEAGEISLSEYIFASDYYFTNQKRLLEFRRDLLLAENKLLKVYF